MKTGNMRTWLEIDKKALFHNFITFQKILGSNTEMMAVVKANAYGHGLTQVALLLANSKFPARIAMRSVAGRQIPNSKAIWFGVDSIDEAITLRKAGIKNKILILGWIPERRIPETLKYNLSFVLYNFEILNKINGRPYKVHLKIETGTNRQGIRLEDIDKFAKKLQNSRLKVEGIYTHFADSENPKSQFWKEQTAKLEKAKTILEKNGIFPKYLHCASTAAACLYSESHKNLVRLGIGLYGLWPSLETKYKVNLRTSDVLRIKLKPVLTWKTRIAQIKSVKKGETIGYDRAYKAKRDMKIAILPVGYYDGYDRGLFNRGEVLIKNKRARVIGRVCMNMMMIDITKFQIPRPHRYAKRSGQANSKFQTIKIGDEIILLGEKEANRISAEEMAEKINTINYEVVARINPLIPRIIV